MRVLRLALLCALGATPAFADDFCGGVDLSADPTLKPDYAAHADDLLNAQGLLWRIDKPGVAPSYLYGTIHSTQPTPLKYAHDAAVYLEKSRVVATELGAIDEKTKIDLGAQMMQKSLSPDADTFAGLIEGEDAQRVDAMLAKKGFATELAHHLKLWMLSVMLALPKCEAQAQAKGAKMVDEFLADDAQAHKIPVVGLETVDEQMQLLSNMSDADAAAQLRVAARDPLFVDGGYATMLSLYMQKRPAAVIAALDLPGRLSDEERKASEGMMKSLLADRNVKMAERAAPLLDKGGAFIAVGALHLSGKGGLIERLRARGFTVTDVW